MEYVKKRKDAGIAEDLSNNHTKIGVVMAIIVLVSILAIYAMK